MKGYIVLDIIGMMLILKQGFSQKPFHDNYSHGADAFRYIGFMIKEKKASEKKPINYQCVKLDVVNY